MPKVLRIINRFNLGGPTYNAAYLSRYLSKDFETLLIGGTHYESEESSEFIVRNLGIEPVIIPEMSRSINPFKDIVAYRKIKNIIRDFKPDIVHTHAAKAGAIGRFAASELKVPGIVHTFHGHVFHSYFNPVKTAIFKNIERNLSKKSSAIVAISERQKHELGTIHKICPPEKIHVIPLGFDLSKFQENMDEKRKDFRKHYLLDEDEIAIVIIGRLVPIKNHALFVNGLKQVLDKTSKKVRAFIIGDGEERQNIEALATNLRISISDFNTDNKKANLTFTSWIKNIDWVCAGSDIVALTSFNEGTPVSLIEAQAANKAIISTNVGGTENIVIAGETALLCENNNLEQFSEKLLELIENDDLRKKLSVKGWENVKEKFHYSALCSKMEKLYLSILNHH